MKISEYISILIISKFICTICSAQTKQIDSLKKVLPGLRDTAKVLCLGKLSESFNLIKYSHSGMLYAKAAYDEAKKINFYRGMAGAMYLQHWAAGGNDFPLLERISREAIGLYKKSSYVEGSLYAYDRLGLALMAQSSFDEAILVLDTLVELSKKIRDTARWMNALVMSSMASGNSGNTEKAFEKINEALTLSRQSNEKNGTLVPLTLMGEFFLGLEDYDTALEYFRQAFKGFKPEDYRNYHNPDRVAVFASLFFTMHQYDSAKYYFELIDTTRERGLMYYLGISEYYSHLGDYDKALQLTLRGLRLFEKNADINGVAKATVNVAKLYFIKQNKEVALRYAWNGLALGRKVKSRLFIRDACQVLFSIYQQQQNADSAFFYYREYVSMNDSILNSQVRGKLAAAGLSQKVELLNKEKEVQQARLQKESILKNIFIGAIVVLLLLGLIIFRNIMLRKRNEKLRLEYELEFQKLESEKTKVALQQQATELEMQALRAQMNPHFIFNSLNSINRFILQNNRTQASEYLTKFSKLVRLILQNSQASLIPLEVELEALELYLDLEAVRFDHRFGYKISVPKDLDVEVLKVPPLIIQPYAENAIWHGLMHKEEKGQLDIEVSQEDNQLLFRIADDGIGRKASAALASKSATKHKSMGLKITADRIAMLQSSNGKESPVTFVDLTNPDGSAAGTEVIIRMPVITSP